MSRYIYASCAHRARSIAAELQAIPGPTRCAAAQNALRHLMDAARDLEEAAHEDQATESVDRAIAAARGVA